MWSCEFWHPFLCNSVMCFIFGGPFGSHPVLTCPHPFSLGDCWTVHLEVKTWLTGFLPAANRINKLVIFPRYSLSLHQAHVYMISRWGYFFPLFSASVRVVCLTVLGRADLRFGDFAVFAFSQAVFTQLQMPTTGTNGTILFVIH